MNLTLWHMPTICSPFSSQLITSNLSSILIIFHQFFTRSAPGNVDLHFSLILVTKANAVEAETTSAARLYHQHNQFIHMTDCMTVMSLSASH